ncbi:hypothetical protein STFE110948_00045 [Streptobacillus felis]|uniref:Uncharacterized protein n=1 Tax=Streptobacillus felis TaxID=1384509 RepID=A0A7Z0PFX3_9FUSO|nr:hypothetical protein [Streptobacillus felis]NYV27978.1 hypothetical protein [Streptobacillus felis]
MFLNISNDIKKIIKLLLIISILVFFIGLIKINIILLSLSFGIFISIISNLMLLYTVNKIVYLKGNRATMFIDSTKRYGIYILALYFVYRICIKFFNLDPIYPMLSCGFGFISFRLVLQAINYFKLKL